VADAQINRDATRAEIERVLALRATAQQTNQDFALAAFFEKNSTNGFTYNSRSLKEFEADMSGPRFWVSSVKFSVERLEATQDTATVVVSVLVQSPRPKDGDTYEQAIRSNAYTYHRSTEREVWSRSGGNWKLRSITVLSESPDPRRVNKDDLLVVPSVTPLMKAVSDGDEEAAMAALAHGVNVQAKNDKGVTALMLSVILKRNRLVRILLTSGADVNAGDLKGLTPLMCAAVLNDVPTTTLLLQHGAKVDARNVDDLTALMIATSNGSLEVSKLLIRAGANVNARGSHKQTALMQAVVKGHEDVVELLLKHGADVNARDDDGKTASMYAAANQDMNMEITLQVAGAK